MKKGLVITAGALLFIGACVAVVDKNENASGTTENMDTIPYPPPILNRHTIQ